MTYLSRSLRSAGIAAILALSVTLTAGSQEPASSDPRLESARAALTTCASAAARGQFDEARAAADIAETIYRERVRRSTDDVESRVALARTLGQCRIPGAELMQIGELSAESIELLRQALEIQPRHWLARYMLAVNYFRAPPFMNRGELAARELDLLIAQQGDRADVPEFARPYDLRGLLWARTGGRDSAVAVWRRGLQLFPADTALRARLGMRGTGDSIPMRPSVAPSPGVQAQPSPPATNAPVAVAGVTVTATANSAVARATPSERQLNRSEVVMTAGATADVLQALQLQPGATRVGDGADLHTRGGDPAETPVFVDGGRMLSISRFEGLSGGLFGAIDPFVVRSARYSSGGFSVRYGNALSGIVDIETDGRPRQAHWRAGVALGNTGATLRRPLGDRTGAWGTLRATHAGAILRSHGREHEFDGAPTSLEGMAAVIAQPALGHELRAVALLEGDESARIVDANGYTGPFRSRGANRALVLSTRHLAPGMQAIVRTNATLATRDTDWEFGILARDRSERSALVKTEIEHFPSEVVTVRAGVEGGALDRTQSGRVPLTGVVAPGAPSRVLDDADVRTWTAGSFVEADVRLPFARVLAGVRADRLPGETDVTLDPRLSISTRRGAVTARLSGGVFHQGRWRGEPAIPSEGLPAGLPREAVHLVAGIEHEGRFPLRIEAFRKDYGDYAEFGAGPRVVDGSAQGIDLFVRRASGHRVSGWLGYSWLDSELRLADGQTVRSPHDVTHTATASATLRVARGTSLGGTARHGTGRPFTPIVGSREDPATGRVQPIHGPWMSERLPAYTRLDARLTQFLPLRRSLLAGYIEAINILDRPNVSGYVWDADYRTRRGTTTFYGRRTLIIGFELQSS